MKIIVDISTEEVLEILNKKEVRYEQTPINCEPYLTEEIVQSLTKALRKTLDTRF